ncbi:hypothetical protein [Iamia sp.]|uniref:hypothetical protein n=1 Tax=Iamia sp. TaxID=2722710 RepID=UPI002D1967BB|nr:hypothetical protein [Iamia sp.]HXH59285.1 hypothetical protein [Iamia sp.]
MTDIDASQIDLLNFDRFTEGTPHEWFTWLRANEPVHFHDEPDGPGFWIITKLDDVMTCNRDAGTFSSAAARGGVVGRENRPASDDAPSAAGNLMLFMDPPDHTRYRRLVNRGSTPRMIGQMEVHVRELTTGSLDEVLPRGESDFVVDIAAELPLEVIAELISVPGEDRHKIFEWSNRMIGADDPEYRVSEEKLSEAQVEMFMYAQGLADKHRQQPADDIITALLSAEVGGESLSDMDFNLLFLLLWSPATRRPATPSPTA